MNLPCKLHWLSVSFVLLLPLHAQDSDNDGASDSLEMATGFDPDNPSSTPPAVGSIGINFSGESLDIEDTWPAQVVTGYLPQINWNQVETHTTTLDNSDVTLPSPGVLVDANGTPTSMTVSATYKSVRSNYRTGRQPENLYSTYLGTGAVREGGTVFNREVDLTISNIPFDHYDVYLYPSAKHAIISQVKVTLNPGTANAELRVVYPHLPNRELSFVPESRIRPGADQRANVLKYSFSNEDSFSLNTPEGGFAAIQIVPRNPNLPIGQVPDPWILIHGAAAESAGADPDDDGLNNLEEFQQGTDPNNPDSDHDGLSDGVETNTGIYVSLDNTGTDPNYDDSDEDGVGDFEEVYAFNPSNPNKVDSDDDGLDDKTERAQNLSALDRSAFSYPLPQETTSTRFRWTQENLHFLWDHEHVLNTFFLGNAHPFINIRLRNKLGEGGPVDLTMGLILSDGKLIPSLGSHESGGFAASGSVSLRIRGEDDLTAAAGFSGFGSHDISDPLTMEAIFEKFGGFWSATFTVTNERTGAEIFRETKNNILAHPSIENGTSDWDYTVKRSGGFPNNQTSSNISFYRGGAALETLPFATNFIDANNDGLPDAWAMRFNVTGGDIDSDGDGLSNFTEYKIGTDPNKKDTDGDGIDDDVEVSSFSDPSDSTSRPLFIGSAVPSGGDLNNNGLSDLWEKRFSPFSSLSPTADPDGDGQNNLQESIAGTDPYDSLSLLSLGAENMGDSLRLNWNPLPNKQTNLVTSETLQDDFDTIPGASSGIEMNIEDNNRQFFRLEVKDIDRDNDGLTDAEETFLGTDPLFANSAGRARPAGQNGTSSISGDYAYFIDRFQNNNELANGAPASSTLTPREASRFLMQATFGPRADEIETLRTMGIENWINDQIHEKPTTSTQDIIDELYRQLETSARNTEGIFNPPTPGQKSWFMWSENFGTAFARASILGEDQLRQRAAFALGQILVISMRNFAVLENIRSIANYHDMLAEHAFGNYYDLLKAVARHPMMGVYLSSLGNLPADPSINRFPDENFGREVMQLFSIGINEMNNDGTFKQNEDGIAIETYTQNEVSEMARVMTGLRLRDGSVNVFGGFGMGEMRMIASDHDFGEKRLFNDRLIIPAKEATAANAEADLDQALLFLFNHENCPPFISQSLIKFLITDNPSPAYVERVSNVFIDDGTGERGNLEAVWKAILLDPEARDASFADTMPQYGRLRDPVVRYMHLSRLLRMDKNEHLYWWEATQQYSITLGQFPMSAQTVFNFYEPDYRPPGPLLDQGFFGSTFQILNTNTSVIFPNLIWDTIINGQREGNGSDRFNNVPFYDEFLPYVDDNEALIDHANLVACAGLMKPETRKILLEELDVPYFANGQNPIEKIAVVLYTAFICPEGAVQK